MTAAPSRKRPGWVWMILMFYLYSVVWTLLSFYRIRSGAIPLNPQQQAYFDGLNLFDYSMTVLLEVTNLAGAISLLLLRKVALYLFGSALVINMLFSVWGLLSTNWTQAFATHLSAVITGGVIGWVIMIAVCLYTWRLTRNGVLV